MSSTQIAVLTSWSFEPLVMVGLVLAAGLYAVGWQRLHARSRVPVLAPWRAWCYGGGLATLALALLSPISTFSAIFFFCHMIEHLLLLLVAPPLLWLGAPLLPMLWAFPDADRRTLGRLFRTSHPIHHLFHHLTSPAVALTLFCVDMAFWHLPVFYSLAEGPTLVHGIEHALFLGTALLFWWPVVHPSGGRRRLGYGAAILYLFVPTNECTAIGALLAFANTPIYAYYARVPHLWGISVLEDQQIGALIMWLPGSLLLLATMSILFFCWFAEEERRQYQLVPRGVGTARATRAHALGGQRQGVD